ncbi:hypothetical protein OC842_001539 [Tilletia horrida]|uniref:Uncharacterized protein n=1 Tax=Tilletia horrida TaxID=155126 RepID=A0AAN6JT34_9BASI|nr:hypothetical protein OC842_001539 [Tilletia horrida]KAK0565330.1 hypothetical protein OC844_001297 [Tilletia horrida]
MSTRLTFKLTPALGSFSLDFSGTGIATGSCCDATPVASNITSGATICQTTSTDATKTLQSCLAAVQGNTNNSVACNLSGKSTGGAGRGVSVLGTALLAGVVAMTVLTTMA